jgi:hypothetical protein
MPGMIPEPSESKLLEQLIDRAGKLVDRLERERAELLSRAGGLTDEQRATGLQAMDRALESARRMKQSLVEAAGNSIVEQDGTKP